MSTDEQAARTSGGIPQVYRNAIFWRWAPAMPRQLRGGFLTLLYALGTAANTEGRLRFRDGKAIRIQDIARAVGSNEKDTRRYINAAIAACVVGYEKPPKRGRATVYRLIVEAYPMWDLAAESLVLSRPKRKDAPSPLWPGDKAQAPADNPESSGVGDPNLGAEEFGSPTPEVTGGKDGGSSGDRHPLEFGSPTPQWFGSPTPEQPRYSQGFPTDGADVVGQPQVDDGWHLEEPPDHDEETDHSDAPCEAVTDDTDADRLDDIARRILAAPYALPPNLQSLPGGGTPRRSDKGQRALLLPVNTPDTPDPTAPAVSEAEREQLRAAGAADLSRVLRAVDELGNRRAFELYGRHLVTDAINARTRTGT